MKKLIRGVLLAACLAESVFAQQISITPVSRMDTGWWKKRFAENVKKAQGGPYDIVFLGDSITDFWRTRGKAAFEKAFGGYKTLNMGYSGDCTEHVLWRLDNGELDGLAPKLIVLMIGTNNTGHRRGREKPQDTVAGVKAILARITKKTPDSRVLLLAIFPRGATREDPLRRQNDAVNAGLAKLADGKRVFWMDINSRFLQPDGTLPREIMPDLLHPNAKGYAIWAEAILPFVQRTLARPAEAGVPPVCPALVHHTAALAKPARPNLVVLLADDLGYGDLGCTGSTQIPTPNIDSLARQGVFCSRAYAAAPICSPSRMGIMTGRFPKRYGITVNPGHKMSYLPESHYGLPPEEKCLPAYLKEFGYTSAAVGKWHLGHTRGLQPPDKGFDTWWGFLGGSRPYFPRQPECGGLNPSKIVSNYTDKTGVTYLTDDIARESVGFLKRQKDFSKPFFLFVSFNAPHTPLQALPADLEKFRAIKPKARRIYCAMVYALDRAVGRILAALDETGRAENTMVVFLSDNGGDSDPASPAFNASCNAPLKGAKRLHFEGGIRVPMIVRYPTDRRIKPGSVCGQVISTLDLLPTMLAENGAGIPANLDGMNLLPLLGMKENKTPRTLYWCTDYTSAILDGDRKYLLVPDRAPQLYDIGKDSQETDDLYPRQFESAVPLARKLGDYLTTTQACRYPEAVSWSSRLMKQYRTARPAAQPGAAH